MHPPQQPFEKGLVADYGRLAFFGELYTLCLRATPTPSPALLSLCFLYYHKAWSAGKSVVRGVSLGTH